MINSKLRLAMKSTIGIVANFILGLICTYVPSINSWITSFVKESPNLLVFVIWGLLTFIVFLIILCIHIYRFQKNDTPKQVITLDVNVPKALQAVVIRHDTLKTWEKIKNARNEIILHAAYYPKYGASSEYSLAFREAMRKHPNLKVTAIITDINVRWFLEFGKILRKEYTCKEDFNWGIQNSITFFKKLQKEYPGRVKLVETKRLPLMPIVIIDNEMFIGNYCHAETPAPDGLWYHYKSEIIPPVIEKLSYQKEKYRDYLTTLSEEDKAIARFIEDAFDACNNGKVITK